jgi:hypothetical protein
LSENIDHAATNAGIYISISEFGSRYWSFEYFLKFQREYRLGRRTEDERYQGN